MNCRTLTLALSFAASLVVGGQVVASHHFETALVHEQPPLNQLDNYVFKSDRPGHTVLTMSVNSAPKPGPGGDFATNALYNIHISDDDTYTTGDTFSFAFDGKGGFELYQLNQPNADPGAKGEKIAAGQLGEAVALENGVKIWTGVINDPFYGNAHSLGLMQAQLDDGTPYDPAIWDKAGGESIFIGRKASAMVLEVPDSMLGKEIRVFMTTAIKDGDAWKQVQFSANPLVSHTLLYENEALKSAYDSTRPTDSGGFKNIMASRIARASELASARAEPIRYGNQIADQLIPDVLTYTPGTEATYSVEKRNGRALADDAMSVMLSLMLGLPVDQKIPNPKLYTPSFPYVIPTTAE